MKDTYILFLGWENKWFVACQLNVFQFDFVSFQVKVHYPLSSHVFLPHWIWCSRDFFHLHVHHMKWTWTKSTQRYFYGQFTFTSILEIWHFINNFRRSSFLVITCLSIECGGTCSLADVSLYIQTSQWSIFLYDCCDGSLGLILFEGHVWNDECW